MRHSPRLTTSAALAAALLLSACSGGSDSSQNTAPDSAAEANMTFDSANDQSAMEMVANDTAGETLPPATSDLANSAETNAVGNGSGETEGGDTGGNTADSNVEGM